MELYGFANSVDQHPVSYGCICMGLINIESLTWLLKEGDSLYDHES